MNINLTPNELVYLYETLLASSVANSEQQDAKLSIVSKARTALLDKLEKVSVESNKTLFQVWASQETKKVEDLSRKNSKLKVAAIKSKDKLTKKTTRKK